MTLATSVASPKHLGLAVYLQHEFGSRKLIDLMHGMGYIISYTELCRFLTSAALHVSNQQESTATGSHIPPELTRRDDGGKFITAATDNWDHNERTVDGKRTTHAMTSILQSTSPSCQLPRLRKSASRTFDIENLPGTSIYLLLQLLVLLSDFPCSLFWCIYFLVVFMFNL